MNFHLAMLLEQEFCTAELERFVAAKIRFQRDVWTQPTAQPDLRDNGRSNDRIRKIGTRDGG